MEQAPPLLVFSDLDGTLLDHDTYDWASAKPALRKLSEIGAAVVLASSKTAAEMQVIRDQMGLSQWPAIVENGAGLLGNEDATDDYTTLRRKLEKTTYRQFFTGFGEMSPAQVAEVTGLSLADATLAKRRQFSEPGLWSGSAGQKAMFLADLAAQGISAREGGRFLTLSFGQTKAHQMGEIIARYLPLHTLALGDAPNDVEMLQTADHGVIIANPHRDPLPLLPEEATGSITRTTDPGPVGWNTAVLAHLNTLNLKTDRAHG
ncbi:MAG: HAD-IIB family hydrolase [Pseudomonadota bacterium]